MVARGTQVGEVEVEVVYAELVEAFEAGAQVCALRVGVQVERDVVVLRKVQSVSNQGQRLAFIDGDCAYLVCPAQVDRAVQARSVQLVQVSTAEQVRQVVLVAAGALVGQFDVDVVDARTLQTHRVVGDLIQAAQCVGVQGHVQAACKRGQLAQAACAQVQIDRARADHTVHADLAQLFERGRESYMFLFTIHCKRDFVR